MRLLLCLAALVASGTGALAAVAAEPAAAQEEERAISSSRERAISVAREVERLGGQRALWPGFDPLRIPLAIYAGGHTYLFRHPSPPEGFAPIAGARPGAFAFEGRHPAVTANSSAEMGGATTATLLADGASVTRNPADLAATAIHEAFHVYQRGRHPGWIANEGDLFLYPTDEARLLALRRLESAALRRALAAADSAGVTCWARLALGFRRERFAGMDAAFSTYERLTELNEGLAAYVQLLAGGRKTVEIPAKEFRATAFRDRIYAIGPALAFVLDRLRPGWQAALETDDTQSLDRMLESAIGADGPGLDGPGSERPGREGSCALVPRAIARIERAAREDAAAVLAARVERRREFEARPGWRLVVQPAEGQPLWPQGFDPLNVERVEGGFLHTRFLRLGGEAGELRTIDETGADLEALTEGVGPHPLFNGVRRVTIAGLAKPEIRTEGRQVSLSAPGLTARFKDAGVQVSDTDRLVRLEPLK